MKNNRIFILLISLTALISCGKNDLQTQKYKGFPSDGDKINLKKEFSNPPKGYGNVPFFWWNGDTLNRDRLKEELDILSESATDGFAVSYIHTSPHVDTLENKNGHGLFGMTEHGYPPVFSDEWWEIWNWFSGECGRRGLGAGLDDYTVGWVGNTYYPDELDTMSAFKDYKGELIIDVDTIKGTKNYQSNVPDSIIEIVVWPGKIELNDKIQNGKLSWEVPDNQEYHVYKISTKTGYVLHPEHGKRLVDVYFNRFEQKMDEAGRNGMNYFFQDELSYPIKILSWSDDFAEEFRKRKGYDLMPYLPALKYNIGNITPKIRLDYCEVLTDLAEERYFKPVYEWNASRGLIYGCDNLGRGLNPTAYIDYFRQISWYTAPGNDAPARGSSFIQTKVSSSISHLYQRPRTWLEAFHSMGWGSSGAWLTKQIDHHFIAGGNLVCMHGLYYSTHGGWWEWAPPDFHFRMPYWPHMKHWLKYTERMSYILSQGHHVCDIAILYPTETRQAYPDYKPDSTFATALKLSNSGIDYDFIDFRSLRNATIENKTLKISNEYYKIIIMSDIKALQYSSLKKIVEFYRAGGIVIATQNIVEATNNNNGENDVKINDAIKELFGAKTSEIRDNKIHRNTNSAGGIGMYIPESPEKQIPELITPDFIPENNIGKVLHRSIGKYDVYMVTDVEKGTECFFRKKGKAELWNAENGTIQPLPIIRDDENGTWIRMNKETGNSYLVVFSPGEPVMESENETEMQEQQKIELTGDWIVELLPTMNNKWGDFRFPATDEFIGAEARSFKYAPIESNDKEHATKDFDDSLWKEEIYGYGPQVETKADGTDWQTVSFSWQYGVWDNPGAQGYHGLKGKVDDRFFILDKGKNQQFRTYVYAPKDGNYKIVTDGIMPDYIRIDSKNTTEIVNLTSGWHLMEVAYSDSEKIDFKMTTGATFDDRKRSFVILYPSESPLPEKIFKYSKNISSRWNESNHLKFDPYAGKYTNWKFSFKTAPGLECFDISIYGKITNIRLDGKEINKDNISLSQSEQNWNKYKIRLPEKQEHIGTIAFLVEAETGYQGAAIIKEPVKLHTSTGLMPTGDWSQQGALHYYSGGMYYRKSFELKTAGKKVMLNLGDVVATCEIKINGKSAGILISPPYQAEISKLLKVGNNELEILVYSTLSNHYQTIPTPYRGEPEAGLIGPVSVSIFK